MLKWLFVVRLFSFFFFFFMSNPYQVMYSFRYKQEKCNGFAMSADLKFESSKETVSNKPWVGVFYVSIGAVSNAWTLDKASQDSAIAHTRTAWTWDLNSTTRGIIHKVAIQLILRRWSTMGLQVEALERGGENSVGSFSFPVIMAGFYKGSWLKWINDTLMTFPR